MAPIQFPFVMTADDYHEFANTVDLLGKIIDPSVVPPGTAKLAQIQAIEFACVQRHYFALIYSPTVLGKILKVEDKETWEVGIPLMLDHMNTLYNSWRKNKRSLKNSYIPYTMLSEEWSEQCAEGGCNFKEMYELWAGEKQRTLLNSEIEALPVKRSSPRKTKKI